MIGHIIQLWRLYFKSRTDTNNNNNKTQQQLAINEEEMKTLPSSVDH